MTNKAAETPRLTPILFAAVAISHQLGRYFVPQCKFDYFMKLKFLTGNRRMPPSIVGFMLS
jgi:hypothetical protein